MTEENAALREKWLWKPVLAGNPERKGCNLVTAHHWLDGAPCGQRGILEWSGLAFL